MKIKVKVYKSGVLRNSARSWLCDYGYISYGDLSELMKKEKWEIDFSGCFKEDGTLKSPVLTPKTYLLNILKKRKESWTSELLRKAIMAGGVCEYIRSLEEK